MVSTNAAAGDVACASAERLQSLDASAPSQITFINQADAIRVLIWIDDGGSRRIRAMLGPGERHVVATFLTHPWMIADDGGNCLEVYLPTPGARTVSIGTGAEASTASAPSVQPAAPAQTQPAPVVMAPPSAPEPQIEVATLSPSLLPQQPAPQIIPTPAGRGVAEPAMAPVDDNLPPSTLLPPPRGPLYLVFGQPQRAFSAPAGSEVPPFAPGTELMSDNVRTNQGGTEWLQVTSSRGMGRTAWVRPDALYPITGGATEYENVNEGARLMIRNEPAPAADVVGVILEGDDGIISLGRRSEGWVHIQYGDATGWSSHDYLRPVLPAEPVSTVNSMASTAAAALATGQTIRPLQ